DVIRLGLSKPAPCFFQPENYSMEQRHWELIERPASIRHAVTLRAAVQEGADIFGDTRPSIPEAACQMMPRSSSLTLVQPDEIWWEIRENEQRKGRVQLRWGRFWHHLPLTDPTYLQKLKRLKRGCQTHAELGLPPNHTILLTISLSEPFKGQ